MELESRYVAAAVILFVLFRLVFSRASKANVPVIGSNALFGYMTAFKMLTQYRQFMVEGHAKHSKGAFQIPGLRAWVVYLGQNLFEDIRKARDDTLSFQEEINDAVSIRWTMGRSVSENTWHNAIVRKQMTQNLGAVCPDVYDEICHAFDDELQLSGNDWKEIHAHDLIMQVVCRGSNRLFVGLPLCRNPHFTKISREFTGKVAKAGFFISVFPNFLKPLVARYWSAAPAAIAGFEPYVIPMIEERRRLAAEYGEAWNEKKPFDFLQWLIDLAPVEDNQQDVKQLTLRIIGMNFAAMHTSSMTFTHAFYWLAACPQYVPALREEVEAAVKQHGWTKASLNVMYRVDSFLKETMRHTGIAAAIMGRKAVKSVTLSDGTKIPAGTHVAVNLWSIHHDPAIYPNPHEFDPFRFSKKVEAGDSAVKNAFTTASSEFMLWGGGSHVCAGRYFASMLLKAMLAHIVMYYDVKLPNGGERPADILFASNIIPNPKAKVMFRKRQT